MSKISIEFEDENQVKGLIEILKSNAAHMESNKSAEYYDFLNGEFLRIKNEKKYSEMRTELYNSIYNLFSHIKDYDLCKDKAAATITGYVFDHIEYLDDLIEELKRITVKG
jgi:hypothetical protein